MADFEFYYWPVPFRGQFVRAILAYAGKRWDEHGPGEISELMDRDPADQPIAFMGPPLLVEKASGFALAQMPAITLYLGDALDLAPDSPQGRALTSKIVNDANDVIDEITLDGGREMWTRETWRDFVPRLKRWMAFWEATGTNNGLAADNGYILGSAEAGIADIVTATLWGTMGERFPAIAAMLNEVAPRTAGLVTRIQHVPALQALRAKSREDYGEAYCGGEIEDSLRKVVGTAD